MATFVPGVNRVRAKGTGGTDSARYCYSVWLRHMTMAISCGESVSPKVVAELGPGDSLGIGLAALISGAERYYAFDIVEHVDPEQNVAIFDELVTLFKNREDIPGEQELPGVYPQLDSYDFPSDVLTDARLDLALNADRIGSLRNSVVNMHSADSVIQYRVPWFDSSVLEKNAVDMIFSQAVLEHVDDLAKTYQAMHSWLKPSGFMCHQIDFRSHGFAGEWNGHWEYSDFVWKLYRGKRAFLLNREPHSAHISLLQEAGFTIRCDKRVTSASNIPRSRLSPRFRDLSDEDLTTSSAFFVAGK
jgi:SAM-dependent methyltransferase